MLPFRCVVLIFGGVTRIESNLMLQIKEAQRDDGELWAIVQNVEDGKHIEFSVDCDNHDLSRLVKPLVSDFYVYGDVRLM
ncbi:hypothetical protein Tco_0589473 [Tanacetum coccineum]